MKSRFTFAVCLRALAVVVGCDSNTEQPTPSPGAATPTQTQADVPASPTTAQAIENTPATQATDTAVSSTPVPATPTPQSDPQAALTLRPVTVETNDATRKGV